MTGKYAVDHTSALADVAEAGAAANFGHTTPGTYDQATDTWSSGSTTSYPGFAIEEEGDPVQYQALELIRSNPSKLFWVPTTYGNLPPVGESVTWNSILKTVKTIQPLAPDGVAIAATIVVAV